MGSSSPLEDQFGADLPDPSGRDWADPSILLKVYAHSRMDNRMEAQAKMIDAMGRNEETAQRFIQ